MPLFKKTLNYQSAVGLDQVVNNFVNYLNEEKWKVQQKVEGNKAIVQAQKAGILRDVIAADRAITFTFEKNNDELKVIAGIGKWIQNIGVMLVETILLTEIFLFVDIPEMLWTTHVENNLLKKLDEIIKTTH